MSKQNSRLISASFTVSQVSVHIIVKCKNMYVPFIQHSVRLCGLARVSLHISMKSVRFTIPSRVPVQKEAYYTYHTSEAIPISSLLNLWFLRSRVSCGVTGGVSVIKALQNKKYNQSEWEAGTPATLVRKNQLEAMLWRDTITARLLICEVLAREVKFWLNPRGITNLCCCLQLLPTIVCQWPSDSFSFSSEKSSLNLLMWMQVGAPNWYV